jgi:putative pyruvate formate lyase activating enzyme
VQGAGTIFFTGCDMRCLYCQNYQISQQGLGKWHSIEDLVKIMLALQAREVACIDLITPNIWGDKIIQAIKIAKANDLKTPIVWNSNAYEKPTLLEKLAGLVDIYLPDFKYGDDDLALNYSKISNYTQTAIRSIKLMIEQVGIYDPVKPYLRGVIIRHLVLPGNLDNSFKVLQHIAQISKEIPLSLMGQYIPVYQTETQALLNRKITETEFQRVYDYFLAKGFTKGWIQEYSHETRFIPDFTQPLPFDGCYKV